MRPLRVPQFPNLSKIINGVQEIFYGRCDDPSVETGGEEGKLECARAYISSVSFKKLTSKLFTNYVVDMFEFQEKLFRNRWI